MSFAPLVLLFEFTEDTCILVFQDRLPALLMKVGISIL